LSAALPCPLAVMPPDDATRGALTPSVEEMARGRLADIRARQPRGPYRLGGYCIGGLVAYETARQLEAQGERVEALFLVDSFVFGPLPRALRAAAGLWARAFGRSHDEAVRRFNLWRVRADRLHWDGLKRGLTRRLARLAAAPPPPEDSGAVARGPRRDPMGSQLWSAAGYEPGPLAGPLTLLTAADVLSAGEDPAPAWRTRAERVEQQAVPGDHMSCVSRHAPALAAEMARRLSSAR
jgi:thioesterase domain-containing protein